jgi:hypothetical protein
MRKFLLAATIAVAMTPAISIAQPKDSAHTLVIPNAPASGRAGTVVPLSQGGVGVTTGGTANYQTLGTPNGSGVMVPGGGGTSAVIGSGGRAGSVTTPR